MARGTGEGRLFKVFPSKGDDYSKEAINRSTVIIRGKKAAIILQAWYTIIYSNWSWLLSFRFNISF